VNVQALPRRGAGLSALLALVPLALLGLLVWLFLTSDPLGPLGVTAPPVEEVVFERAWLDAEGIHLRVRADGSEPVRIAQVQVDGAYWSFVQDPPGPLGRLQAASIHVPYPWVEGETHFVALVTGTGLVFEHEIAAAVPTPPFTLERLLAYALLGIYVGVVPVSLGLLFYPALRSLGARGMRFLLALTVGLLAFLLIDTLQEGLALAAGAAGAFQGGALVWLAAAVAFLALLAVGRRRGRPVGLALAGFLALGIGLHNLGEGLAIGAALAAGEVALGSFLVVGFTLHNVTEGVGIAGVMTRDRPTLARFVALAALAGLPAVLGTWFGAFAYAPQWAALFLGLGAGAILQVIVEVGAHLAREEGGLLSGTTLAGFAAGLAVMYLTAMLVSV